MKIRCYITRLNLLNSMEENNKNKKSLSNIDLNNYIKFNNNFSEANNIYNNNFFKLYKTEETEHKKILKVFQSLLNDLHDIYKSSKHLNFLKDLILEQDINFAKYNSEIQILRSDNLLIIENLKNIDIEINKINNEIREKSITIKHLDNI